jgi:outer membrane protein TolC
LPLDRVVERNVYRRALLAFEASLRSYSRTRDTVLVSVRDVIRALRLAQTTLDIQRRSVELAQRRLDYSGELLTQGQASARDVTDAQSDLLNAQDNYNQAKAQLQVQILTFLRVTGTLRLQPDSGTLAKTMDVASTGLHDQIRREAQTQ